MPTGLGPQLADGPYVLLAVLTIPTRVMTAIEKSSRLPPRAGYFTGTYPSVIRLGRGSEIGFEKLLQFFGLVTMACKPGEYPRVKKSLSPSLHLARVLTRDVA